MLLVVLFFLCGGGIFETQQTFRGTGIAFLKHGLRLTHLKLICGRGQPLQRRVVVKLASGPFGSFVLTREYLSP